MLAERRVAENAIKTPRMWDLGLWKKKKETRFKSDILRLEVKVEFYYMCNTHTHTPICLKCTVSVVQTGTALPLLPVGKIINVSIDCGLRNKPG